jgi:hypothetical protein
LAHRERRAEQNNVAAQAAAEQTGYVVAQWIDLPALRLMPQGWRTTDGLHAVGGEQPLPIAFSASAVGS